MRTIRFRLGLAAARPCESEAAALRGQARSLPVVGFIAVAMLLGSCASYRPRPLVPEDELTRLRAITLDGLRIEHARPGIAKLGAIVFDPSDGLDEAELVGVALTLNPELRARRLEIGEAQALLVTAGLWPNPELGAAIRPGIAGASGSAVDLDSLFALLRPDERGARKAVAEAHLETTRAEIAAQELRVATEVRRARVSVLAAEQVVRLLEVEAALRDEAVALVRKQQALGEAKETDVVLLELERANVQRELRDARAEYDKLRRSLNQVLGVPPSYDVRLSEAGRPLFFTVYDDLSDDEVDRRILAGRFDLRARVSAYRQAEQELRLAVARQYPGLSLGPSFQREVKGDASFGLGASIEIPLFARNQGEIAEKDAARERLRAEYAAVLHDLRARAFEARATLRRARNEVELQQREVVPLTLRTEALFEGALRARELTIFEWLAARSRTVQTQRGLLDALVRYASATAELESATGLPLSREPSKQEPKDIGRR